MSSQTQASLEAVGAAPIQARPDTEPLDLRDPTLTDDQNERYDRLVDNAGFTRAEALRAVGAPAVAHETEEPPTQVGPFIVERGGLPKNVHFGDWKNDA